MAELTLEARQALYERDIKIIDTQADAKIVKLGIEYHKIEARHLAAVEKEKVKWQAWFEKKKVQIKADWDRALSRVKGGSEARIANVNERYDGLVDIAELDMEQHINGVIEQDMRVLDPIEQRFTKGVEEVEAWRAREKADESHQLETRHQRQRKP